MLLMAVFDASKSLVSVLVYVVDWFAFALRAVCVRLETGLLASDVSSTLPSPTIDFVMPCTVPENIGSNLSTFLKINSWITCT